VRANLKKWRICINCVMNWGGSSASGVN